MNTWKRDSYQLFDYEANQKDLNNQTFKIAIKNTRFYFYRVNNSISVSEKYDSEKEKDILFSLKGKNNWFKFGKCKKEWQSIRQLNERRNAGNEEK